MRNLRKSLRRTNKPSEDGEHTYPPHPIAPETPKRSTWSIFCFTKVFAFRRKRAALHTPSSTSSQATEPGATTPSTTSTATSDVSKNSKPHSKKPVPPIVVPSWRYKAQPQTFTVRVEQEFSVTCTVVHPVSCFHFGWPTFLKFNYGNFRRRSRSGRQTIKNGKKAKRAKRKSRGGIAIEQNVCDELDAWSIVEHPHQPQPQPRPRPRSQTLSQQEKQVKAARRNSAGWAGVFSATPCQPDPSTSGSSGSRSRSRSRDDEEHAGFAIDRNSHMLVVPEMDIGIARVVKEELVEFIDPDDSGIRLVRARNPDETFEVDAFGRDSVESWLDLE